VSGFAEDRHALKFAAIAGPSRSLGLLKIDDEKRLTGRVPELLRSRGWPVDLDLCIVLAAAIGLKKIGVGRQLFRRPSAAQGCGGKWPADAGSLTASQIVVELELSDLLQA
jgi:hypothetical protein